MKTDNIIKGANGHDFDFAVTNRQSCRSFSDKPVDKELLLKLINNTRMAPSACNSQPWRFIVVQGEKARLVKDAVQLDGRNKFTEDCPAFTIVVEQKATLAKGVAIRFDQQKFAQIDIGIATAFYTLTATNLGLSTCILGWFDEEKINKDFNISPDEKVRLVLATGYAADNYELRNKVRKSVDEAADFICD